jgi:DnaJ-domain-containing protein 1
LDGGCGGSLQSDHRNIPFCFLLTVAPENAMLTAATYFCRDDAAFGQLFAGRYLHVLWESILPAHGCTNITPLSGFNWPRVDAAPVVDESGTSFAEFLADVKRDCQQELSFVGRKSVISAAGITITFDEAIRTLHAGPIRFFMDELASVAGFRCALSESVTGAPARLLKVLRSVVSRVAEFAFTVADLMRRSTSPLQLVLDAIAHIDRRYLDPRRLSVRDMLRITRIEVINLVWRTACISAVTAGLFFVGRRQLLTSIEHAGPPGTGLPKADLLAQHLLLSAIHQSDSAHLEAYFFNRLWAIRALRWLYQKAKRAPLLLIPAFVKRRVGLQRSSLPPTLSEDQLDAAAQIGASVQFYETCLNASVTRTVMQRNLVSLVYVALAEQGVWLDGYRRAHRCGAPSYVYGTLVKFHVLSSMTLAFHIGATIAVRLAGAHIGHRIAPRNGVGAFWCEATVHFIASKYLQRAMIMSAQAIAGVWDKSRWAIGLPFAEVDPEELLEQAEMAMHKQRPRRGDTAAGMETTEAAGVRGEPSDDIDDEDFEQQAQDEVFTHEDYFTILGVSRDASPEDVKRAYRKKALQVHPDKVAHLSAAEQGEATAEFKKISQAHAVLSDPNRRREYVNYQEIRRGSGGSGGGGVNGGLDGETERIFRSMNPWLRRSPVAARALRLIASSFPLQLLVVSAVGYGTVLLALAVAEGHLVAQLRKSTTLGVLL